jgi:hypothetical protein
MASPNPTKNQAPVTKAQKKAQKKNPKKRANPPSKIALEYSRKNSPKHAAAKPPHGRN